MSIQKLMPRPAKLIPSSITFQFTSAGINPFTHYRLIASPLIPVRKGKDPLSGGIYLSFALLKIGTLLDKLLQISLLPVFIHIYAFF